MRRWWTPAIVFAAALALRLVIVVELRDTALYRTPELDSIEYWFVQRGTRIHKTVHYYLMEPTGGDISRHDHEFDDVRWIRFAEAPAYLTFETERALVAKAAAIVDPESADALRAASGPVREGVSVTGGVSAGNA